MWVALNFSADNENMLTNLFLYMALITSGHLLFFFLLCMPSLAQQKANRKSQDGKVFKRITGRLCQTTQDKEITFTNPTLWCQPHKMSFSSAIIEHWADYCAGVISYALSLLTFKVSCLSVCPVSVLENVLSVLCCMLSDSLTALTAYNFLSTSKLAISNSTIKQSLKSVA